MRFALFLLLALTLRAAIPGTTLVPAPIAPPATNSDFEAVSTIYIKGGTWTGVANTSWLTDTNRYPMGRRDPGQLAILTDQTIYQLGPDLSTWAPLTLGGGGSNTNLTGVSLYGETYIENGKIDTATFKFGASLGFDQMDSFKAGKTDNAASQLFSVQQTPLVVTNVATLLATPRPARGRTAWVQTGEWKGWWQFCPDEMAADNGTTIRRPTSIVTDGEAGRWVFTASNNYAQGLASNLGLTGLQSLTLYPLVHRTAGQIVTLTNGVALQLASDLTTWNTFGGTVTNIPGNAATATTFKNSVTPIGDGVNDAAIQISGGNQKYRKVELHTGPVSASSLRWSIGTDNVNESGNGGSGLVLARYSDTGTLLSNVLSVDRSNGSTILWGAVTGLGGFNGVASSATKLATARTIGITGDLTWTSPSFDGTANVTAASTLATVNANVGTFGSSTLIPVITANAKGLITGVTTVTAAGGGSTYDPYIYKTITPIQILNSTTETSLFPGVVTIPASTLTQDGETLDVVIPFKFLNNSGANRSITFKVKVGGVVVFEEITLAFPTGTGVRVGAFRVNVMRRSTTTAFGAILLTLSSTTATTTGLGDFAVVATQGVGGFEAAAWTWASDTVIDVTAAFNNATGPVQLDTYGANIRR